MAENWILKEDHCPVFLEVNGFSQKRLAAFQKDCPEVFLPFEEILNILQTLWGLPFQRLTGQSTGGWLRANLAPMLPGKIGGILEVRK
ncbi:MAG: hypothetical protein LBS68_02075 [Puniceicoccales bacterium]|jgi:hypothetical protein|nr:hypothetical protein [Puniceicoccales bacterium]